ncbi:GntR family transcriptional regulator [Reyranella sp. CPCC 100927]|uniref:GntR family transcriptional regulator n=1 Tax=Reyranella sp. CPCC 100927 TaxID=2599616 RepID=UPI0011B844CA|nr:GntR family transcriptional regulator [Reyranella sp. CPCC 100927]TWT15439.1 GntR family transcriptional regulator [Reyranella sp. CPCC 100927]
MDAPSSRHRGAASDSTVAVLRRSTAAGDSADSPTICALPLPQQIADHLGHQIMNGDCPPGSRLKEEKFAEHYQVSRGPVREAFRILERRGFVEIVPRHGARVRVFDPADLAALFSVRGVLLGLAARQAIEQAAPDVVERLAAQVARLRRSAEAMDITPLEHAKIAMEAQEAVICCSGNRPLIRMMEELKGRALWRMAWHETPLDFTSRARRQQSARLWGDMLRAIKNSDADGAERIGRLLLEASRDHMLAAMAAQRRHAVAEPEDPAPSRRRPRRSATAANETNVTAEAD